MRLYGGTVVQLGHWTRRLRQLVVIVLKHGVFGTLIELVGGLI